MEEIEIETEAALPGELLKSLVRSKADVLAEAVCFNEAALDEVVCREVLIKLIFLARKVRMVAQNSRARGSARWRFPDCSSE